MSEEPRLPTNDERLLARECARLAQRAVGFLCEVAAGEREVSDLLVERMWDFSAFPVVSHDMPSKLPHRPNGIEAAKGSEVQP